MDIKKRAQTAIGYLKELYPFAPCSLKFEGEPYKLLIMARLSAQCTDERVNRVCADLFRLFPTLGSFAECEISELERSVFSCGLYRTKARDIKAMCRMLLDRFNGEVPSGMDELLSLPGVGRKIANLIRGDIFLLPAIVADTHCIRITNRLGLCGSNNPQKTEAALLKLIPPEESGDFCHRLVFFGRDICKAQNPRCGVCKLNAICKRRR